MQLDKPNTSTRDVISRFFDFPPRLIVTYEYNSIIRIYMYTSRRAATHYGTCVIALYTDTTVTTHSA